MSRQKLFAAVLASLITSSTNAESLAPVDGDPVAVGRVEYVDTGTLQIGIGDKQYRLDAQFQIHGLTGADRLQQLREIRPGMHVRYSATGSDAGDVGVIQELWVQAE